MKTEFKITSNNDLYKCTPKGLAVLNNKPVRVWELRRKIENGWLLEGQFSGPRTATKARIIQAVNIITEDGAA